MAKLVLQNGAHVCERTRVNWGNGGSSLLQVNHQYHFPTSQSEYDFIDHDTWVSIVLDDAVELALDATDDAFVEEVADSIFDEIWVELALSTICRSKVGTPLNGGQPITYQCDGAVTNVVRQVASEGGDLNALLNALQDHGTGLVPTAMREFIHTYNNVSTLRRVYTLEFWGEPLPPATPRQPAQPATR